MAKRFGLFGLTREGVFAEAIDRGLSESEAQEITELALMEAKTATPQQWERFYDLNQKLKHPHG